MEELVKEFLKGLYRLKFNYLYADFDFLEVEFFRRCTFNKGFSTANYEGSLKSDNYIAEILIKYLEGAGYESSNYILIKPLLETEQLLKKEESVSFDGYKINLDKRMVLKDNKPIILTNREYELLAYFITKKGLAISREEVLSSVWARNYCGRKRVVDDTLRRIRKKMPNVRIQTIYGYGYRFD